MQNTAYYEAVCGCILTRERLVKGPAEVKYRLVCSKHLKPIRYKFGYCQKCGRKIQYTRTRLQIPRLCIECDPVFKRKSKYNKAKRKRKLSKLDENQIFEILMQRSDCVFRPLCSEVHIENTLASLPCHLCNEYEKKDPLQDLVYNINLKQLDNHIKSKQNFDDGVSNWGKIYLKRVKDLS